MSCAGAAACFPLCCSLQGGKSCLVSNHYPSSCGCLVSSEAGPSPCTPCIPASYLFTGFACFTGRTSGARETLEVGNGGGERRGLEFRRELPTRSQPPDSCEASPGIRGSQQGLVHLSHQQGPVRGERSQKGPGGARQVTPRCCPAAPRTGLPPGPLTAGPGAP